MDQDRSKERLDDREVDVSPFWLSGESVVSGMVDVSIQLSSIGDSCTRR